eukprot:507338-Prorocentrum_minimum.AAC.3
MHPCTIGVGRHDRWGFKTGGRGGSEGIEKRSLPGGCQNCQQLALDGPRPDRLPPTHLVQAVESRLHQLWVLRLAS